MSEQRIETTKKYCGPNVHDRFTDTRRIIIDKFDNVYDKPVKHVRLKLERKWSICEYPKNYTVHSLYNFSRKRDITDPRGLVNYVCLSANTSF